MTSKTHLTIWAGMLVRLAANVSGLTSSERSIAIAIGVVYLPDQVVQPFRA